MRFFLHKLCASEAWQPAGLGLGTGFPSKRAQRRSEDHHLEHEAEDREHFGEKKSRNGFQNPKGSGAQYLIPCLVVF